MYHRSSRLLMLLLACIAMLGACSDESMQITTEAGPIGETVELPRHPNIADITPTDEQIVQYEAEFDIGGSDENPPATVVLRWDVFLDAPSRYLLSYAWEVITPSPGMELKPLGHGGQSFNIGTQDAILEQATLYISWDRSARFLIRSEIVSVIIGANGQWVIAER